MDAAGARHPRSRPATAASPWRDGCGRRHGRYAQGRALVGHVRGSAARRIQRKREASAIADGAAGERVPGGSEPPLPFATRGSVPHDGGRPCSRRSRTRGRAGPSTAERVPLRIASVPREAAPTGTAPARAQLRFATAAAMRAGGPVPAGRRSSGPGPGRSAERFRSLVVRSLADDGARHLGSARGPPALARRSGVRTGRGSARCRASARASACRSPGPSSGGRLIRAELDDLDIVQHGQAVRHHALEFGHEAVDFPTLVDDLDEEG